MQRREFLKGLGLSVGVAATSSFFPFRALAWAKKQASRIRRYFVLLAAGSNKISVSIDGVNWSTSTLPPVTINTLGYSASAWNGSVFCAISSGALMTSPDGVNWTERAFSDTGLTDICSNGSIFCMISSSLSWTSSDGINWTSHAMPSTQSWVSIAWNGSVFCTVAAGDNAATSPDGATWTYRTLPSTTNSKIISKGSTFLVLGGGTTTALTSTDGISWTAQTLPADQTKWCSWSKPVWNGSISCSVGYGGGSTTTGSAMTSTDGLNWTLRTLPSQDNWVCVAWNGTIFCAIGQQNGSCATSPDGITWTSRTIPFAMWNSIAWNGSLFCVVSQGTDVMTSPDGSTWTSHTLPGIGSPGLVVANGSTFFVSSYTANQAFLSTDGATWTTTNSLPPYSLSYSIAANSSIFCFIGDNLAYTSSDGLTWTSHSMPAYGGWFLEWNGTMFCSVGGNYTLTSPDGITWTFHNGTPSNNCRVLGVCGSKFVIIEDQGILYASTDGISWPKGSAPAVPNTAPYWLLGTSSATKFCLVDGNYTNAAAISNDGVTWTLQTLPGYDNWSTIGWNGSVFCVVGASMIATSPDGITWTQRTQVLSDYWTSLTWGNSKFVAFCNSRMQYLTSSDGITWTAPQLLASSVKPYLTAGAWNGKVYCVLVSNSGNAFTSPDGINWAQRSLPNLREWGDLIWTGSKFCALSSTSVALSTDAITWNEYMLPALGAYDFWLGITWNGSQYTVISREGTNCATSPDGQTWTKHTTLPNEYFTSQIWKNGVYLAFASNYYKSTDGINWSSITVPAGTYPKVAHNGKIFCAPDQYSGNVITSSDGINWTQVALPGGNSSYTSISTTGTKFLLTGNGTNVGLLSPDGTNWTTVTLPTLANGTWGSIF